MLNGCELLSSYSSTTLSLKDPLTELEKMTGKEKEWLNTLDTNVYCGDASISGEFKAFGNRKQFLAHKYFISLHYSVLFWP